MKTNSSTHTDALRPEDMDYLKPYLTEGLRKKRALSIWYSYPLQVALRWAGALALLGALIAVTAWGLINGSTIAWAGLYFLVWMTAFLVDMLEMLKNRAWFYHLHGRDVLEGI